MSIPKHKREALIDLGLDPEYLNELETLNAAEAAKAAEEGIESKEVEEADEEEGNEEAEELEEEEKEAEEADETKAEEEESEESEEKEEAETEAKPESDAVFVTADEAAEAIADVLNPVLEQFSNISERLESVEETVKELQKSDEEKIAEKAEEVPAASLQDLIFRRVIGKEEARVKGNTQLGKAKPKEAEKVAPLDGVTGIPFIDTMLVTQDVNEEA